MDTPQVKPTLQEQMNKVLEYMSTLEKPMTEMGLKGNLKMKAEELHRIMQLLQRDKKVFQPILGYWKIAQ